MFRRVFYAASLAALVLIGLLALRWPAALWSLVVVGPLIALGLYDSLQRKRAVLRNWPVIGRFRYVFETLRPEIQQYFIESDTDGRPFPREWRSVAYRRAKGERESIAFGTQHDVNVPGYEWMAHSLAPRAPAEEEPRVTIGGSDCRHPYEASRLNVSGMSFGALSANAVTALNRAARAGGFAHNTGEGGICAHHRQGGDLIWQIGTGYFGCRTPNGDFCPDSFAERAADPAVRMIEVKLSQGSKPGRGGLLPGSKVTEEIAAIRGVPAGQVVISPPHHRAFSTPTELLAFVARLRELSGGKPVGIKLCVGDPADVLGIVKAMLETDALPDFITVDGSEGGTGSAPLEFSDSVGMPLREGLSLVHNALVGAGLRDRVAVAASGKIITGFHMVRALAIGADFCMSARAMMFALGCIQTLRCNTNKCPVGVATQRPSLAAGLDVEDKSERVRRYHDETVRSFLALIAAAGLRDPDELRPGHVWRRVDEVTAVNYAQIYPSLEEGVLLEDPIPQPLLADWARARADAFAASAGGPGPATVAP